MSACPRYDEDFGTPCESIGYTVLATLWQLKICLYSTSDDLASDVEMSMSFQLIGDRASYLLSFTVGIVLSKIHKLRWVVLYTGTDQCSAFQSMSSSDHDVCTLMRNSTMRKIISRKKPVSTKYKLQANTGKFIFIFHY